MALILYRVTVTLLAPVLGLALLWRWARGRETLADLEQRLGAGQGTPGAIWLHGASNGELTSAKPLVQAMLGAFPDLRLVITANTTTGRDLVKGWAFARVSARLAPLDYRPVLARFRVRWRPAALIVLENELWPNRIVTARAPVLCVATRMSERSAARWVRLGGVARAILARVSWLSAQDDASAARFVALGLDAARLGPVISLKPTVELAPPGDELAALSKVFARADTLLAASTHDGEDAILLEAFTVARAHNPRLRLILAPRHPRRAGQIAALIRDVGLTCAVRSKSQPATTQTDVYLVDTLGEMPLWYALAGITFVGGSLVDKGGHTPFEPAQAGSAILRGPHVANFAEAYAALDSAGAAITVSSGPEIAGALSDLGDTTAQRAMADTAHRVLTAPAAGGTQPIISALRVALSSRSR